MEFKKYKISDIAEVIGGGTPSTKKTEYYGDDIAWLTPKDLSNFNRRYISKGERSLTTLGLQSSSARLMPANTVLFTSRAPIGYVAISKNNISTNQGFKSLICRQDKIFPEYMYYLMKFNTPALENQATGSTFKEVSGTIVKNFEVLIPDINEQKKIIGILGSLDSKIELNLDLISKLEEISKVLFKHWFIDFEFPNEEGQPYKSSGGEMVESELGLIPKVFRIGILKDFCELKYGKALTTKNRIKGLYPVYGSGGMTGTHKDFLVEGPGLIIGRKGSIGTLYLEFDNFYPIDTVFYTESINYTNVFLYLVFKQYGFTKSNNDSAVPGLNREFVYNTKTTIPDNKIIEEFEKIISPLYAQINNLLKENKNLTHLRNTLLPKLLSGEIEIPDEVEV